MTSPSIWIDPLSGKLQSGPCKYNFIDFNINYVVTGNEKQGAMYWDENNKTYSFVLENNVIGQLFEEDFIAGQNDTGDTLQNGCVATYAGSIGNSGNIRIAHTVAAAGEEPILTIGILTHDIVDGARGKVTTKGKVRGIQTDGVNYGETWLDGQILYKSPTVAGGLTNVEPQAPIPAIPLCVVISAHESNGTLLVRPTFPQALIGLTDVNGTSVNTTGQILVWDNDNEVFDFTENILDIKAYNQFYNGTIRETFDCLVESDGVNVTATLEQQGGGDLTLQFSDGTTVLDCTPIQSVALTPGSDQSPQSNFIYIPFSTKTITVSTTGWPSNEEHIKLAYVYIPSATHAQDEGAYINQNWNDHLANGNLQGHMSHMAERARLQKGYNSGMDANGLDQNTATSYFNYISGSESYFKMSSGVMFQLHRHTLPAIDTEVVGDDIHVVNWNGENYYELSQLNDIVADSEGASLSNKYFNLFFFAVGNKTGEYSPMMCMLPSGSYSSAASAQNDVDGYDNLTMPRQFILDSGVGVPICRMTLRYTGGTSTLTHISTTDLRSGGITASGGGTGTTTTFADNQFEVFNVTDSTKILNLDASAITTGNTRTLTIPDANGTIALTSDLKWQISSEDSAWLTPISGKGIQVPEGQVLQIGSNDEYPTQAYLTFGDTGYSGMYEKYDDGFCIAAGGVPSWETAIIGGGNADALYVGWDSDYENYVGYLGDLSNTDHGKYIRIDGGGLYSSHNLSIAGNSTFTGTATFNGNLQTNSRARFLGSVSESISGVSRIDAGVNFGTPRMVFEHGSSSTIWQIDNEAGNFRWYLPFDLKMTLAPDKDNLGYGVQLALYDNGVKIGFRGGANSNIENGLEVGRYQGWSASTQPDEKLNIYGNSWHERDNDKAIFGDNKEAEIYYDGTDMIINPKAFGSGKVIINSHLEVDGTLYADSKIMAADKIIFTQVDENEYIDSLNDGYMDYGATTAHRFNNTVNINDLTASLPVWTDANKNLVSKAITACDLVRSRIVPSVQTVNTGTLTSGTVTDVQVWQDGNEVHVTEVTGVPGYDVEYRIDNVADFCFVGVSFRYVGSSTHECQVQIYNDTTATWLELFSQAGAGLSNNYRFSDLPGDPQDFINSSDQVKIRFYHPQTGDASHDVYIEYVSIIGTST
jgi:hypothetical protein